MKHEENYIEEIKILGKTVFIDHETKEIVFPEDINDEELNSIACYLHAEGFLEKVIEIEE